MKKNQVIGFLILVAAILLMGINLKYQDNMTVNLLSALISLTFVAWFIHHNKQVKNRPNR